MTTSRSSHAHLAALRTLALRAAGAAITLGDRARSHLTVHVTGWMVGRSPADGAGLALTRAAAADQTGHAVSLTLGPILGLPSTALVALAWRMMPAIATALGQWATSG